MGIISCHKHVVPSLGEPLNHHPSFHGIFPNINHPATGVAPFIETQFHVESLCTIIKKNVKPIKPRYIGYPMSLTIINHH